MTLPQQTFSDVQPIALPSRCRPTCRIQQLVAVSFGFDPAKHDAAEACGLLDYQLSLEGVFPPWREAHLLQRQMIPATERRAAG